MKKNVLLTNKGRKGGKKRGSKKQYEDVRLKSNSVSIYIAVNTLKMQKLSAWFKNKNQDPNIYSSPEIHFKYIKTPMF